MQMWEGFTLLSEASALELNGGHQSRGNSAPSLSLKVCITIAPVNTASSCVANSSSIGVCQQGASEADAGPETLALAP
jgi:hypothetical protein